MAKLAILKGATERSEYIFIPAATKTDGSGATGITATQSGLVAYYVRPLEGVTAITLSTTTGSATHGYESGGLKELFATRMPGVYRFDIPDAAFATGSNKAVVMLWGSATFALQIAPTTLEYQLISHNPEDPVRLGLTALPNAAAEAAGGLFTRGSGAGQINQDANGRVDTNTVAWLGTAAATPTVAGVPEVDVTHFNGTAGTFSSGRPEVNTSHVGGTLQTAGDIIGDTNDIQARLPAALTAGGNIKADTLAISGSTESADRIERSTLSIVTGTIGAGSTTTSIVASAVSPASSVNDQFKGRIMNFDKDTTTAALRGQSTDITAYTHATTTFTVTALTTAPASGDTFSIT